MAEPMKLDMFGLPIIMRHDYAIPGIREKLQEYQKKSADAFLHFMTNVPTLEYGNFLDVGCGDDYVVNYVSDKFTHARGIDLYVDAAPYTNVDLADWYTMSETVYKDQMFDAIFVNHSLEHAANVYALMQQIKKIHKPGGALFVAVPDGNSEFGYGITSSTTHFSCITEGYLSTTLQRFGYNVQISRREFRTGAPEIWAFAIKH